MKKISLLLTLLLAINTLDGLGQRYSNQQITMFSYKVDIEDRFKSEISPFEGYIKLNVNKKQDKLVGFLIHNLYELTTGLLADSMDLSILPPSSLSNKAKYNDYGYPDIGIHKAQRLSDSHYFLKITASFDSKKEDMKGNKVPESDFIPEIKIKIELYGSVGVLPVQSATGVAYAQSPVKVNVQFLNKLNFIEIPEKPGTETVLLKNLMLDAIQKAIYKLRHNR